MPSHYGRRSHRNPASKPGHSGTPSHTLACAGCILCPVAVVNEAPPAEDPPEVPEAPTGPENGSQGPSSEASPGPNAGNGTGDGDRDENGRYIGREAATFRRRLRETEAERDTLREQLDRAHRAEVERIAGAELANPSDIWVFGATVETLRGEDGAIDTRTVEGVARDIVQSRPGLRAPVGRIGVGRGGSAVPREPKVGLSQLLK